jgi:hypothetical protein
MVKDVSKTFEENMLQHPPHSPDLSTLSAVEGTYKRKTMDKDTKQGTND